MSCAVADALDLPTHPHGSALWKRRASATSTRSYKAEIDSASSCWLIRDGWVIPFIRQPPYRSVVCLPPRQCETQGDGEPAGWPRLGPQMRDRVEEGRAPKGRVLATASRGDPQDRATENRPPMAGSGPHRQG